MTNTHVDQTGCNLTTADFGDETVACADGAYASEHPSA